MAASLDALNFIDVRTRTSLGPRCPDKDRVSGVRKAAQVGTSPQSEDASQAWGFGSSLQRPQQPPGRGTCEGSSFPSEQDPVQQWTLQTPLEAGEGAQAGPRCRHGRGFLSPARSRTHSADLRRKVCPEPGACPREGGRTAPGWAGHLPLRRGRCPAAVDLSLPGSILSPGPGAPVTP